MIRVASFAAMLAVLLCWGVPPASAQVPPQPADGAAQADAPSLTSEQKLLIYQSVSAMHKNSAAPPGFRPAVGAQVPPGIELEPMPGAVGKVIPELKGAEVAMVEKQVVVVDPKSRSVLAVVTHTE